MQRTLKHKPMENWFNDKRIDIHRPNNRSDGYVQNSSK